jgi:hypothetical protein
VPGPVRTDAGASEREERKQNITSPSMCEVRLSRLSGFRSRSGIQRAEPASLFGGERVKHCDCAAWHHLECTPCVRQDF